MPEWTKFKSYQECQRKQQRLYRSEIGEVISIWDRRGYIDLRSERLYRSEIGEVISIWDRRGYIDLRSERLYRSEIGEVISIWDRRGYIDLRSERLYRSEIGEVISIWDRRGYIDLRSERLYWSEIERGCISIWDRRGYIDLRSERLHWSEIWDMEWLNSRRTLSRTWNWSFPAALLATHVYNPLSDLDVASKMSELMPASFMTILWRRSSYTSTPSRYQNMSGFGLPLTTQSNRAIWPSGISRSFGTFRKTGLKYFSDTPPKSRDPRRGSPGLQKHIRHELVHRKTHQMWTCRWKKHVKYPPCRNQTSPNMNFQPIECHKGQVTDHPPFHHPSQSFRSDIWSFIDNGGSLYEQFCRARISSNQIGSTARVVPSILGKRRSNAERTNAIFS